MLNVGSKVSYVTSEGVTVLGKVTAHGRDKWGELHVIKVTSRNIAAYPVGSVFVAPVSDYLTGR